MGALVAVFILGIIVGILIILLLEYLIFFNPWAPATDDPGFNLQFTQCRIPIELKQLLLSPGAAEKLKKPETPISLNLVTHFLYQEFRSTRRFRRWVLKRLQMEFNDVIARTAAGKLLQDIRVRDFNVGNQFPVIKELQVENVTLGADKESIEELDIGLDLEYRGGFHISVDVIAVLGRKAFLSMKVTRVAGRARLRLSRHPFTHWSFAFEREPTLEFAVESQFHGRPLPQLVPLIIQQFRRAVRRKHVLPHYKIRYRPFFSNPLMQPSSNVDDFTHIKLCGALQIHIRSCSRLNMAAAGMGHSELVCEVTIGGRPFTQGGGSLHFVSMIIKFSRHSIGIPVGIQLSKINIPEKGIGSFIQVASVKHNSPGHKAGFRVGDVILAVNNLPITTEKQATKLLNNTSGELAVLIDRKLANIENEDDIMEKLASQERFILIASSFSDLNLAPRSPTDSWG